MATDTTVRARIDEQVKREATDVLDAMGLSVSDAIRMLLIRIAAEKALPFEARVPNAATVQALAEIERGKARRFNSKAGLFKDLGI